MQRIVWGVEGIGYGMVGRSRIGKTKVCATRKGRGWYPVNLRLPWVPKIWYARNGQQPE